MNYINKTIFVLLLATLISVTVQPAIAGTWNISGYVNRSDTGVGVASVTVYNTSNSSMTATTDANGWYKITGFGNRSWGHNITATGTNGFRDSVNNTIVMQETDKYGNITYLIITPSASSTSESSITKSSAVVTFTANDSFVGNKIRYSTETGLGGEVFDSDWLNSTTNPSITLTNLKANTKYYYTAYSFNKANSSYVGGAGEDSFTTLKAGTSSYYNPVTGQYVYPGDVTPSQTQQPTVIQQISDPNNRPKVVFAIVAILAVIMYTTGMLGGSKPSFKRKGRK